MLPQNGPLSSEHSVAFPAQSFQKYMVKSANFVLVGASVMIKHHDPKQFGGGKGLFHLTANTPTSREVRAGTQGWNPEADTKAEAMGVLLTSWCPRGLFRLLS